MSKRSISKILSKCRFCHSDNLEVALDLGMMPLAGGFLKPENISDEYFFPLELQFCKNCYLVQVSCVPDPNILFNVHSLLSLLKKRLILLLILKFILF